MPSYEVFALIPSGTRVTLAQAVAASRERLIDSGAEGVTAKTAATDTASVYVGGWGLHLQYSSGNHVLAESAEIAGKYARERTERERIGTSGERIELTTDSDPEGDHFNDYMFVCEALDELGAILFDPKNEEFV